MINDMVDTPFGNSMFQILNFTAGQETPERRYRHCSLQLSRKQTTLKECEFRRKRLDIDIEELQEDLENHKLTYDKFKIKRIEIDIEEKEYGLDAEIKLIEDCLFEVRIYEKILEGLPTFTREQFEESEYKYWEKRLINDAKREITSTGSVGVGTMSSLENIGINITRNKDGKLAINAPDSALSLLAGTPEKKEIE